MPVSDLVSALCDPARLAAVHRTMLLEPAADEAIDRFTRLAAQVLGASGALVTLLDAERQLCRSAAGITAPRTAEPVPVAQTLCQHVVATNTPLLVEDVRAYEDRTATGAATVLGVAAYAGVPLRIGDGQVVGTLCALDRCPRAWSAADVVVLEDLARAVAAEIELRITVREAAVSRQTTRVLLDASPDAFLAIDADDRVTYMSDLAATYHGCVSSDALGQPLEKFITPSARAGSQALHARVRATGAPATFEVLTSPTGHMGGRWMEVHAVPSGDAGVAIALRDVTARRTAADALREREAVLRQFVEHAPAAVAMFDREMTYLVASRRWCTDYGLTARGFTPESLIGRSHREVFADAPASWDADYARVLDGEIVRCTDETFVRGDGSIEHMRYELHPWRTGDGAIGGLISFTEVTTAQVHAQRELRTSEARYRALTEHSPEPIYLHRDGRVLYANPAGARLLGAPNATALVGATVMNVFHPDESARAAEHLAALTQGERQEGVYRYRLLRADRSEVEVESVSALVQLDGAPAIQTLFRDVTERNVLERKLTYQAFHDPLTGLANRALFLDRLGHALTRLATGRVDVTAHELAVIYLDLDDFKTVNDSLGHAHGDALLREVGARLLRATRGCDTVARLGGDEFAVLLDGMTSRADALTVVQRVAAALADSVWVDGHELPAGASVGVAYAQGGERADDLLRNADVAMYRAKASGKRHHAVFEPGMHAALVARLEMEADLRRAVDRPVEGGLWVAYQPVIDMATGHVVSFEALARWTRPNGAVVPPLEFVPLAESSGLIVPLGRWVLGEACARAAEWRAASGRDVRVAVNVSARQLAASAGLAADVERALAAAGLPAAALTLEMTESVLMQRTDETLVRLAALKATGVQLAIDDFGTGYSSLAYLQRFPVDVLKIDKAFVDGVAEDGGDRAIARTVVALGQSLGLRIVAEGVEHAEQRDALAAMGCGQGQGYLFARPLTAADALRLLAEPTLACGPATVLTPVS